MLLLDFVILTKVYFVLFQLSEFDSALGKKKNLHAFM